MTTDPHRRYYQLVFIWLKDAEKFGRYCDLTSPVVERYGGALERMLAPDSIHAEATAKPDIVNVVHYDSPDAFATFNQDPEFRAIVHLRSESIDMAQVGGTSLRGSAIDGELDRRLYVVEVARYGANGRAAYHSYEQEAEPVMARYGYSVERVLDPVSASGFPFEPDIVKIAYFASADGMDRMHRDPAHVRIENELYPAAVDQSVWVVGRVHPATLPAVAPASGR